MTPTIRPARLNDVDAIAAAHVAAWREAYRGLLPESVLADLTVAGRADQWRQTLTRGISAVLLAEGRDGGIAGFVSGGPRRTQLRGDAEIYALYVRAETHRQGLGRGLMRAAAEALQARGFRSLGLWVLRENAAARAFYERLGGNPGGARQDREAGYTVDEVAYEWPDLSTLLVEAR